MKRVHRRSLVVVILVCAIISGMLFYLYEYAADGGQWVGFAANAHLYHNGQVGGSGTIYDYDGANVLSYNDGDGRTYNSSLTIRTATLHTVGDLSGNIGTGALRVFSDKLTGYNVITGLYGDNGEGNKLYLTIDADVCAAAYNALNGRNGAVGVYNYKTGEIVCLVSTPGFDPLDAPTITDENEDEYDGVYINRFISATYPPGSIFKLVTSAAAIDNVNDIENMTFECNGSYEVDGVTVTCPNAHGTVTFQQALTVSCNCTYAQIAQLVGSDKLYEYASNAGLLDSISVNGINTSKGNFDSDISNEGNLAWAGIGQYTDMVNPCSFMYFMGSIANGGQAATPEIISKVTSASGFPLSIDSTSTGRKTLSSSTAETLKTMMRNNVLNNYGDGNFPDIQVCAKSGTAEVGGDKEPNAWFAGFCDNDEYPYAFVCVIENGGSGSQQAAPVISKVLYSIIENIDPVE